MFNSVCAVILHLKSNRAFTFFSRKRRNRAIRNRAVSYERLEDRSLLAAFTPGNLVVYRTGDGNGRITNSAAPAFLDEVSQLGALRQSIALPTAVNGDNHPLTASFSNQGVEGLLTRSVDGRFLAVPGYGAIPGVADVATTGATRVVGIINAAVGIDTTTDLRDWALNGRPSGAVTTDGTAIWLAGSTGGVRHTTLGALASTLLSASPTVLRNVNIFGNQLYVSRSGTDFRIGAVGSGTPTTSGNNITGLPGVPTGGDAHAFFFADLSSSVAGVDTLYIADEDNGLQKFSLINGNWASRGGATVPGGVGIRGLTGIVANGTVTLFATDTNATSRLLGFTDSSGQNGTVSGTLNLLSTNGVANSFYRGIALVPSAPNAAPIHNLPATEQSTSQGSDLVFDTAGANLISITDEVQDYPLKVTLSASNGRLTLSPKGNPAFLVGTGSNDITMTFTGNRATINRALDGLKFTPDAGFTGTATVSIATDDQGFYFVNGPLSDADSFDIAVTAVTRFWDGGGGLNNNWSEPSNWSDDTVPQLGNNVVFNAAAPTNSIVDASFAGTIGKLTIETGYTGTITLARSLTVGSVAGSLTNLALGNNTLSMGADNTHTRFTGVVSGAGGLSKVGTGSFYLQASSSYDGATTISDGSILVSRNDGLGTVNGGTTVAAGANARLVFERSVNYITEEPVTINGSGFNGVGSLVGVGNSSFAGPITLASASTIGAYPLGFNFTLTGSIDTNGHALTVKGPGTTNLAGAFNGGGAIAVVGGTLSPGAGVGTLSATSANFSSAGVLKMQVQGFTAGSFDQLNLTGPLTLGGTAKLSLDLAGLPAGSSGVVMGAVTYGSVSGTFLPTIELINGGGFRACNLVYGPTALNITIAPPNGACGAWTSESSEAAASGALDLELSATRALAAKSRSVTVASLDSGVDYTHPDLHKNIWINSKEIPAAVRKRLRDTDRDGRITLLDLNKKVNQGRGRITDLNRNGFIDGGDLLRAWSNGRDEDRNGYVDDLIGWDFVNNDNDPLDDSGHGTHGAGVMVQVAPRAVVMPLKFLDSSTVGTLANASRALDYALAQNVTISSNGWAASEFSQEWLDKLRQAEAAGHLFVTAAGNGDPALLEILGRLKPSNLLVVAAADADGNLASFSNWDPAIVDLTAPGVGVISTMPGGGHAARSGTSVSTAFVAGMAALQHGRQSRPTRAALIDAVMGDVNQTTNWTPVKPHRTSLLAPAADAYYLQLEQDAAERKNLDADSTDLGTSAGTSENSSASTRLSRLLRTRFHGLVR